MSNGGITPGNKCTEIDKIKLLLLLLLFLWNTFTVSLTISLGQISNNVPGKSPAGIFEEKEANHFF